MTLLNVQIGRAQVLSERAPSGTGGGEKRSERGGSGKGGVRTARLNVT
jgi:hypothetical protein